MKVDLAGESSGYHLLAFAGRKNTNTSALEHLAIQSLIRWYSKVGVLTKEQIYTHANIEVEGDLVSVSIPVPEKYRSYT